MAFNIRRFMWNSPRERTRHPGAPGSPSTGPPLVIGSQPLRSIERCAVASIPFECCGILIGRVDASGRQVETILSTPNVYDGDRRRRYEIDPKTAFDAFRDARRDHREVIGFYHSHPDGTTHPSSVDLRTAWPGKSYLIVAVRGDRVVDVRSWFLPIGGDVMIRQPIV